MTSETDIVGPVLATACDRDSVDVTDSATISAATYRVRDTGVSHPAGDAVRRDANGHCESYTRMGLMGGRCGWEHPRQRARHVGGYIESQESASKRLIDSPNGIGAAS